MAAKIAEIDLRQETADLRMCYLISYANMAERVIIRLEKAVNLLLRIRNTPLQGCGGASCKLLLPEQWPLLCYLLGCGG